MYAHSKWIKLFISTSIILILAAFSNPARGVVASGTPGGFLSMPWGTLTDPATGEFGVTLFARESDTAPGAGDVTLQVLGPGVSVCSTHGGGVDIGTSENGFDFSGNFPLTEIQCGTAYGMAVSIDSCTAKTEMHGYVHSDYPYYTFTGSTTIEATVRKSASSSQVSLKIYTPKGPIKLSGTIPEIVEMDTCP